MTNSETNWTTYAFAILTILAGFVGASLLFAGIVLAWAAATSVGTALGLGSVLLAIAIQPFAWKRRLVGAVLSTAALGCLGWVVATHASAEPGPPSGISVVGGRPTSFSPIHVVSELDQLFVASHLVEWTSREETDDMTRLRADIRSVYREYDAEFASVPSLLDDAVRDECSGRSFVWAPTSTAAPEPPDRSILFVHGYGGSWSGYLRVMRPVATALDATLVQPSCGVGRWTTAAELDTFAGFLTAADAEATNRPRLDVVALSNGGLAVSRRLDAVLARASSLVLISPVFDLAAIAATERPAHPIPVLVIHGDADTRVPEEHVRAGIERLRRLRLEVRQVELPGADHYAMFHDRAAIRREIEAFLGSVERPRARGTQTDGARTR